MSKILMESLKMDLPSLAELIRSKGRGKDTMLAHITPKEAALLKRRGGSGTINPDTGLPEFEDDTFGGGDMGYVAPQSPVYDVVNQQGQFQPTYTETKGAQAGMEFPVGQAYTPGDLSAYAPAQVSTGDPFAQVGAGTTGPYVPSLPPTYVETPTPAELKDLQRGGPQEAPTRQGVYDRLSKFLGSDKALEAISRLGLTGALGVYGAGVARRGAGQIQAATQEQKAIAQPYQQQGQQLVAQAQRGELTPQSQQALDAAKAQLAQATATRGGVGAQQAANQIANLYQTLLGNQYTYGLSIMQIGDNYATGAIKSGLQLDQQLQQSTNNFYAQLASIAAGGSGNIPFAPSTQPQRT